MAFDEKGVVVCEQGLLKRTTERRGNLKTRKKRQKKKQSEVHQMN